MAEPDLNPDSGITRTALVLTDGDDSVFYGEGEEVQQPAELGPGGSVDHGRGATVENADGHSEGQAEMKHAANGGRTEELLTRERTEDAEDGDPEVEEKKDLKTQSSEIRRTQDRGETGVSVPDEPPGSGALDRLSDADLEDPGQDLDTELQSESNDGLGESPDKPFNHLRHAKYGTVSYRQIQRGHTKKRIKEFESMMQF